MTKTEIAKLLAIATANWPNMQERDMTPTAAVWEMMLSDMTYETAQRALVKVMTTAKFFPTIAEIREAAMATSGNQLPSAEEAWNEVESEIRRVGSYGEPKFSNAVITKAVDSLGGWVRLCRSEEPPGVERAHFVRFYTSFAARENERQNCATLLEQLQARIDQRKQPQLEARH